MSFDDKIEQSAKILGVSPTKLHRILVDESTFILMKATLDEADIATLIRSSVHNDPNPALDMRAKSAARILIGAEIQKNPQETQIPIISSLVKELKPIANWSDREILEAYVNDRSDELEAQLIVRSKGRRFVVVNPPDTDSIDVESTLRMLKRARKEDLPEFYRTPEGSVIFVHRINDLNRGARTRHVCPVCLGILFEDHCSKCDLHFGRLSKEQRQFVYVAARSPFCQMSGEQLLERVLNGYADLHPSIWKSFNERRDVGDLPLLMKIEKPYTSNVAGDPFKAGK